MQVYCVTMGIIYYSYDVFRYVWSSIMFIIGYPTKDEDVIIEQLTHFNGETIIFKTEAEARAYISKLYVKTGVNVEPFEDDGLLIMRVQ